MASTNRAFCASNNRAFVASTNRARGCGGWELCVGEERDYDPEAVPGFENLGSTSQEASEIVAAFHRWAWAVNSRLDKVEWVSGEDRGYTGAGFVGAKPVGCIVAEKIKGGDFVKMDGLAHVSARGVGRSRVVDGATQDTWLEYYEVADDAEGMALDAINRRVMYSAYGTDSIFIRDVDTGALIRQASAFRAGPMVAVPVGEGGVYVLNDEFTAGMTGLIRRDKDGNSMWSKLLPGEPVNINTDTAGNVLVMSSQVLNYQFIINPDGSLGDRWDANAWVRKYNPAGDLLWEWSDTSEAVIFGGTQPPSEAIYPLHPLGAAGNDQRVIVAIQYTSEAHGVDTVGVELDADTGSLVQKFNIDGVTKLTGPGQFVPDGQAVMAAEVTSSTHPALIALGATPQESGPEGWSINRTAFFNSRIVSVRPVVTLSPP